MRLKIRTYVLCSFSAMLLLLAGLAAVALDRTDRIGRLAGDLNGRLVDKTKIADEIVALGQRIRFVDSFLPSVSNADQEQVVQGTVAAILKSIDGQTASYAHYIDSPLERSLLQNLQRTRSAYLKVQQDVLAMSVSERNDNAAENEDRLASAFDLANRQARGLSHLAEAQARDKRDQALAIEADARMTVCLAAGLGVLIGALILVLLLRSVFRPLARITKALVRLSQGHLDVSLFHTGRGGEIDAMAQALDVFRKNASDLSAAHEEVKAAHRRADSLSRHDALTGLPNRRVLAQDIDDAVARSQRQGHACAVLLLDLDRFKPINDVHGHGAGDRVLCEIANRLNATVRAGETAARLGGDEFAIVLEYELGTDVPHRVAKRIATSIAEPIAIEGRSVSVGTSIGIAVWPSDGQGAESLLHAADLAMFKAKRERLGGFSFFKPEMDTELRARADLEARIGAAIQRGDIRPHYQPLVDLVNNVTTGFEVLARWYDGETIRPPIEFIPIAEDAALMPDLTYSLLRQACRDARGWPGALTLAVNITPAQISNVRLPEALFQILDEEAFPAHRLELEITENALIGDVSNAKRVITTLRERGIRISLDDFGTGYSSLHHLRDLKFDRIKIDRSFVQSMLTNDESTKIVQTVLGLGKSLGILTIAEGIEDEAHLQSLLRSGCQLGQGYLLGRPLPADKVLEILAGESLKPTRKAA